MSCSLLVITMKFSSLKSCLAIKSVLVRQWNVVYCPGIIKLVQTCTRHQMVHENLNLRKCSQIITPSRRLSFRIMREITSSAKWSLWLTISQLNWIIVLARNSKKKPSIIPRNKSQQGHAVSTHFFIQVSLVYLFHLSVCYAGVCK